MSSHPYRLVCGVSCIVGGSLLQAELSDVIWKIQLVAALLAAAGLLILAAPRNRAR